MKVRLKNLEGYTFEFDVQKHSFFVACSEHDEPYRFISEQISTTTEGFKKCIETLVSNGSFYEGVCVVFAVDENRNAYEVFNMMPEETCENEGYMDDFISDIHTIMVELRKAQESAPPSPDMFFYINKIKDLEAKVALLDAENKTLRELPPIKSVDNPEQRRIKDILELPNEDKKEDDQGYKFKYFM